MLRLTEKPLIQEKTHEVYSWEGATLGIAYTNGTTIALLDIQGAVSIGVAKCMPIDKFSKEVGRHLAFTRALKSLCERSEKQWLERSISLEDWSKKHKKNGK